MFKSSIKVLKMALFALWIVFVAVLMMAVVGVSLILTGAALIISFLGWLLYFFLTGRKDFLRFLVPTPPLMHRRR